MSNIIFAHKSSGHHIQKYRYKNLGTSGLEEFEETEEEEVAQNQAKEEKPKEEPKKEVAKEAIKEVQAHHHHEKKEEYSRQNVFIEELLKKVEELTDQTIKIQMRSEKQQDEFERKAKEERQIGFEEGKKIGLEEGKIELESKYKDALGKFANSVLKLDEFAKKQNQKLDKLENELSLAALAIAKEVVAKEIDENSSRIARALAKELLQGVKDSRQITLKINSKDLEEVKDTFTKMQNITVVADDAISAGGVIILSDEGNIDATVLTRLQKIKEAIESGKEKE